MEPEHEQHAQRNRHVREEIQEEEGGGHRALSGERARDRLGEDRERVEHPRALAREELAEGVPHHHVAGPSGDQRQQQEKDAARPRQGPRSPAPSLREHAERVHRDRDHGDVARVAVHATHPVAEPWVGGDAGDGIVGCADAIEKDEPEPGDEQQEEERRHDGSALVERVVARLVQAIAQRVERSDRAKDQTFERARARCHEWGCESGVGSAGGRAKVTCGSSGGCQEISHGGEGIRPIPLRQHPRDHSATRASARRTLVVPPPGPAKHG